MENLTLTTDMIVVLALLAFTIFLFVSEVVRVDVAAVSVMVLLGLLSLVPGLGGITDADQLFAGFASNAVISIIAVMIIGAGLDKTGVMHRVAAFIMRVGGATEQRIIPTVSGTVGVISSFMQNVGAAALFMPVMSRISNRLGIPLSRLLMPMGFAAIVGGTITLVGSSPLILLNDLLPEGMEPFHLFDVTPIGLALLASAIVYFVVFGRFVLPSADTKGSSGENTAEYFQRVYGLNYQIREANVASDCDLVGLTVAEIEQRFGIVIIGSHLKGDLRMGPWSGYELEAGQDLAVLGSPEALGRFLDATGIRPRRELKVFADAMAPGKSGVAEVVIAPGSSLIGKTVTDVAMRRTYGLSVLRLQRGEEPIREGLRDVPLRGADTLVVHCDWESLARLEGNRDFVIVTSDYPREQLRPSKVPHALAFLALALGMILFTDLPLSVSLLTGALGMILTGVLDIDDAYRAVSWKTVFLLASLIPLGAAVENTGTAAWIAQNTLDLLGQVSPWVLQATIFALATFFTLVMSNVGATVLLVPLSINFAMAAQVAGMEADPRVFALTVAIATSNSFLIPTHQVNALIMGPGGYRVKDYLRAGSIMTLLFMVVALVMLNIVF
ncbi:SLC13 permease family protein [Thioalkalivibrio nitratireducens DSM 14787]|uniref:SLC13 permease family protein n=1 Tax=Thioalkalivibrio nitratireducens (strain DSM 14787 / UNIQEM 213 / ALEN2) TaxID=1255043 RepID=L0E1W4_THIND|nr:SLC13 family permease [Thioalkalivibrio nitratireducens]AGA35283.1 SLC13 permease family protein [Thioalkalivibrio nitratireducens DSM 14787]